MPTSFYMDLDVLIVGAGFSGLYQLHALRPLGLSVKIFEAGGDIGGVWYWNCYPGARVDTEGDVYQFSLESIWGDWHWNERYPDQNSVQKYFHHVDRKWDLKKDIILNTRIKAAEWTETENKWYATTEDGKVIRTKFFIICAGVNSEPYIPKYEGLETFKGIRHHTARWPRNGVDLANKRVAIVGTGASGVQVSQEAAACASKLIIFQRTANPCIPMHQHQINTSTEKLEGHKKMKQDLYPIMFRRMLQTVNGLPYSGVPQTTFSVSPEERRMVYEQLYWRGGFALWVLNYSDVLVDKAANDEVYAFWRQKTLARIKDPKVGEKLAPAVPQNPFGVKRISLEQNFYDIFNQDNVELVDVMENPIERITETGILIKDGTEHEVDVLVMATGFDSITGGITAIDIKGRSGTSIRQKWSKGASTYLGMASSDFPNMFFTNGPQSPSGLCIGPVCAELHGDWLVDLIKYAQMNQINSIEARSDAEEGWRQLVVDTSNMTLFAKGKSWYNGSNIPGKPFDPLCFIAGNPLYRQKCRESAEQNYEGFILQ